jgi:hypothetical protein
LRRGKLLDYFQSSATRSLPVSQENMRMGDYEILGELGAGGMGKVYRVRNVLSDRIEAMKVLLPDLAGRQELAARFLREIKVLASLNHPNIAQLRTAVTMENQLVMIMEFVEGTNLADRIERGPIAPSDALNYIDQVLNALSYAHSQHVIHRDIKPANMMLTPQGAVKLMDFGIARSEVDRGMTMTGSTLGSLSYMSPEQTMGEPTDSRSDLYSVGISLYEMVTGQRPFQGDSDFSIMAAQVKEMPKPPIELQPGLPPALNEIILMAIAKDPGQRFQSADALRNALANVRKTLPMSQPGTRGGTAIDTPIPTALMNDAPTESRTRVPTPLATMLDAKVTPRPSGPMATMLDAKVTPRPTGGSTGTVLDAKATPRPGSSSTGTILDARVTPVAPPPPARASSSRGLYMALGAVVMLAGLVAAAFYIPRHNKTEAKTTTTTPDTTKAVTPAPTPTPPPVAKSTNPAGTPSASARDAQIKLEAALAAKEAMRKQQLMASNGKMGTQGTEVPTNAPPPPAPAPDVPNAAAMDELEHQIDQLTARAAAVNNSLDTMQHQQQASGYGMRGDIVSRQASMKLNLSKAQDAFEHHDAARAERYAALTQSDLQVLEHFLGR